MNFYIYFISFFDQGKCSKWIHLIRIFRSNSKVLVLLLFFFFEFISIDEFGFSVRIIMVSRKQYDLTYWLWLITFGFFCFNFYSLYFITLLKPSSVSKYLIRIADHERGSVCWILVRNFSFRIPFFVLYYFHK